MRLFTPGLETIGKQPPPLMITKPIISRYIITTCISLFVDETTKKAQTLFYFLISADTLFTTAEKLGKHPL